MKKLSGLISILLFLSILLNPSFIEAEENKENKRVIVKYNTYKDMPKDLSFKSINKNKEAKVDVIEVPASELNDSLQELESLPQVEYAVEDIEYEFFGVNDPYYNDYQSIDFDRVDANKAWNLFKPKKRPVVAVLDSGVHIEHPDLKNQIVKPYNVLQNNNKPVDDVGHGTHVAGIVGAQTNNQIGIASLSKGVSIMPVKVGDANRLWASDIAKGIKYAVDNGADIINLSLGGAYNSYVEEMVQYAYDKNVLVVAAAGNNGSSSYMYPAAYPTVLSVGAIDGWTDYPAHFSNFGTWVSVTAPGVDILSTYGKDRYEYMDGTSMASPMVASLAGLLKNHAPELNGNQLRYITEVSAEPNPFDYGWEVISLNGRINAGYAMKVYSEAGRIFGPTSVETSNDIAGLGWYSGVNNTTLEPTEKQLNDKIMTKQGSFAILASNQSFPDSLAAGALSKKLDAPIVLTFPDLLKDSTVDTLRKFGVSNVLILGGEAAVSKKVFDGLRSKGFMVDRLSGTDRFKTAVSINDYVAKKGGEVIVANARNFPDALSVSSFAGKYKIPVVFVEKDTIPTDTKNFLKKYNFSKTIIVGGPNAITEKVMKELPNPVRVSGNDRYDTNIKIIEYFNKNAAVSDLIFATGANFPDALAGGSLGAKLDLPIILTDKTKLPTVTKNYIQKQKNNSEYSTHMVVLGGDAAISSPVLWELDALVYDWFYRDIYSNGYFKESNKSSKLPEKQVVGAQ
ncbi:S8 family serine peptidase [Sutcliffiella halmapala]|uniref:S8 family serine peptidase n=1 Tax=Sutcliffiella halmapala TaxID=79882 RepID=UPI00111733CE|nr:S8 family serine peptidase [Sutcliffiella halmapala]